MPKGYWVSVYPTIDDPERLDLYNELAGLAVKAAGGRTFARGGSRVVGDQGGGAREEHRRDAGRHQERREASWSA